MDTSAARALFRSIDQNGDEALDLVELECGLSEFGYTDAQIEDMFFDLDIDGDGQVTEEEFIAGYGVFAQRPNELAAGKQSALTPSGVVNLESTYEKYSALTPSGVVEVINLESAEEAIKRLNKTIEIKDKALESLQKALQQDASLVQQLQVVRILTPRVSGLSTAQQRLAQKLFGAHAVQDDYKMVDGIGSGQGDKHTVSQRAPMFLQSTFDTAQWGTEWAEWQPWIEQGSTHNNRYSSSTVYSSSTENKSLQTPKLYRDKCKDLRIKRLQQSLEKPKPQPFTSPPLWSSPCRIRILDDDNLSTAQAPFHPFLAPVELGYSNSDISVCYGSPNPPGRACVHFNGGWQGTQWRGERHRGVTIGWPSDKHVTSKMSARCDAGPIAPRTGVLPALKCSNFAARANAFVLLHEKHEILRDDKVREKNRMWSEEKISSMLSDKSAIELGMQELPTEVVDYLRHNFSVETTIERFNSFDVDGNGVLDVDELFHVIEELVQCPWPITLEHCKHLVDIFVKDGDGQVHSEQFHSLVMFVAIMSYLEYQKNMDQKVMENHEAFRIQHDEIVPSWGRLQAALIVMPHKRKSVVSQSIVEGLPDWETVANDIDKDVETQRRASANSSVLYSDTGSLIYMSLGDLPSDRYDYLLAWSALLRRSAIDPNQDLGLGLSPSSDDAIAPILPGHLPCPWRGGHAVLDTSLGDKLHTFAPNLISARETNPFQPLSKVRCSCGGSARPGYCQCGQDDPDVMTAYADMLPPVEECPLYIPPGQSVWPTLAIDTVSQSDCVSKCYLEGEELIKRVRVVTRRMVQRERHSQRCRKRECKHSHVCEKHTDESFRKAKITYLQNRVMTMLEFQKTSMDALSVLSAEGNSDKLEANTIQSCCSILERLAGPREPNSLCGQLCTVLSSISEAGHGCEHRSLKPGVQMSTVQATANALIQDHQQHHEKGRSKLIRLVHNAHLRAGRIVSENEMVITVENDCVPLISEFFCNVEVHKHITAVTIVMTIARRYLLLQARRTLQQAAHNALFHQAEDKRMPHYCKQATFQRFCNAQEDAWSALQQVCREWKPRITDQERREQSIQTMNDNLQLVASRKALRQQAARNAEWWDGVEWQLKGPYMNSAENSARAIRLSINRRFQEGHLRVLKEREIPFHRTLSWENQKDRRKKEKDRKAAFAHLLPLWDYLMAR